MELGSQSIQYVAYIMQYYVSNRTYGPSALIGNFNPDGPAPWVNYSVSIEAMILPANGTENLLPAVTNPCDGAASQRWTFVAGASPGAQGFIQNVQYPGLCLGTQGTAPSIEDNPPQAALVNCSGPMDPDQTRITWQYVTNQQVNEVKNVADGRCLDVGNENTAPASIVVTWPCKGAGGDQKNENWQITGSGAPLTTTLVSALDNQCLDVGQGNGMRSNCTTVLLIKCVCCELCRRPALHFRCTSYFPGLQLEF
jgi:hypothetical protein